MDDTHAVQYLVGAAIAALAKARVEPRSGLADEMGRTLAILATDYHPREFLVQNVVAWVDGAGTDDPEFGHLGTPHRRLACSRSQDHQMLMSTSTGSDIGLFMSPAPREDTSGVCDAAQAWAAASRTPSPTCNESIRYFCGG
jgi:hypothetical protein